MNSKFSLHLFFAACCFIIISDSFAFRFVTLPDTVKKEYPCPAHTTLNLCIASKEIRTLNFEIVDHSGRVVAHRSVSLSKGCNSIPGTVSALSSGTFPFRFADGEFREMTRRFIKL